AGALDLYRAARRLFVDELGWEPSPELQRLEHAILEHDPSLQAPPRRGPAPPRSREARWARRGRVLVGAGVAVVAAATGVAAWQLSRGSSSLTASPNSVAVISGGGSVRPGVGLRAP